jgi:hypothetical protein
MVLVPPDEGTRKTIVRLSDGLKDSVDMWAKRQVDQPGRSEAVSRLILVAFKILHHRPQNLDRRKT